MDIRTNVKVEIISRNISFNKIRLVEKEKTDDYINKVYPKGG